MIKDKITGKMRRKTPEERITESQEVPEEEGEGEIVKGGGEKRPKKNKAVSATFISVDVTGASLYWEDQFWSKMEIGVSIDVNTFVGHRWFVKIIKAEGEETNDNDNNTPPPPPLLWQIADDDEDDNNNSNNNNDEYEEGKGRRRQIFKLRQSDLLP